jgi:hypothetical protein
VPPPDPVSATERPPPSPAAVAFIITEHAALAGARAATTTEAGARANVFLGSVSGGLIALGFIGQASHLGAAFFAFGLILLPTLAFVGLTTFLRTYQSGLEDARYADRIARLRAFYFDHEPALDRYLLTIRAEERLEQQGISASPLQKYLTMSGTVAVITAALIGATAGLAGAVSADHSPWAAFVPGVAAAALALALMVRYLDRQISAKSARWASSLPTTHTRHRQQTPSSRPPTGSPSPRFAPSEEPGQR